MAHYSSVTYLFYNWKFAIFDPFHPFHRLPPCKPLATTDMFFVSISFFFFFFLTSLSLKNHFLIKFSWQNSSFATLWPPGNRDPPILPLCSLHLIDTVLILSAVFYDIDLGSYCLPRVNDEGDEKDDKNCADGVRRVEVWGALPPCVPSASLLTQ